MPIGSVSSRIKSFGDVLENLIRKKENQDGHKG